MKNDFFVVAVTVAALVRITANPFGDVLKVPANGTETSQVNMTG